ncbi:MAG: peptide chain release factor N(5)-glutamine methyltransferase [Puniceicoccales bacterium]|jgi:release factor glutamine methyltransferase|nr:peptide chain release factor N(5)-glutamine methyltransferase [Puniceicoccales bacterium]
MQTLGQVLKKATEYLTAKGIPKARLQAEILLSAALGINRLDLYLQFERPLPEETLARLRDWVRRRANREPPQYITGTTPFRDLTLKSDPRALIPRPETEELVGHVLAALPPSPTPVRIADLGTGTGAIALALAQEHAGAILTATDASAPALDLARENARATGLAARVEFLQGDWLHAIPRPHPLFHAIVSNPPYLTQAELSTAAPEVVDHEPRAALLAGDDGLEALLRILGEALPCLQPDGFVALETGIAHATALAARATALGYVRHESREDLSGRPRFFFAWL